MDLTRFAKAGNTHNLIVYVKDEQRSGLQTIGKQCNNFYSGGCSYTRVTGIWQTVWLEAVAPAGLKTAVIRPDIVEKLKSGNMKPMGAIIGAVMRATRGQADAKAVTKIVMGKIK